MTIEDTISLGPVNLPIRYLLFALAAAFGYGAMSLLLRKREKLRETTASRLVNAFVIFVAVWKLEPLAAAIVDGLRQHSIHWTTVWLNLLLPGGVDGTLAGAAAVFAYLALAVLADVRRRRREGAHSISRSPAALVSSAALLSALLPAALAYLLGSALLQPSALIASRRPTAVAAGREAAASVTTGTAVGDRAPSFTAETLKGGRLGLPAATGRTIVLNFWATWCPPCRAELPGLVSFAAGGRGGRIAVWAVNMTGAESSLEAVRRFSRENKIDFPVLLDPTGRIAAAYGVASIPTTFIISPRGIILAKQVGAMSPGWLRSRIREVGR